MDALWTKADALGMHVRQGRRLVDALKTMVVSHSDAFAVVALDIGRGYVVLPLRPLAIVLRSLMLLSSGAAPRPSSLVLR